MSSLIEVIHIPAHSTVQRQIEFAEEYKIEIHEQYLKYVFKGRASNLIDVEDESRGYTGFNDYHYISIGMKNCFGGIECYYSNNLRRYVIDIHFNGVPDPISFTIGIAENAISIVDKIVIWGAKTDSFYKLN